MSGGVPIRQGGVYGAGSTDLTYARTIRKGGYTPPTAVRRALIGADWMTGEQLHQAIPPDYTADIGRQLIDALATQPNSRSTLTTAWV